MKVVTRALTVAEYKAKAALMGMWYGDKANVYVEGDYNNRKFYDADTGEEISSTEVARRIKRWELEVQFEANTKVSLGEPKL